jgi:spermidine synthase
LGAVERFAQVSSKRSSLAWVLGLFFLSGATSLVYEVLWTRRLSLTFGHTVMAVSTVLTVFMTGLALGSFLAGRWSDRERQRLAASGDPRGAGRFLAVYGYLEIFIGAWAVLSLLLLNGVEAVYLGAARGGTGGGALHALVFLGSFMVLLPPTTAMGATLPAFTQLLVVTKEDVGTWLSRIYGWNTLGACCGAAMGGFVLLPLLGLKASVVGAALANLAIGVVAVSVSRRVSGQTVILESETPEEPAQKGGSWLLPVAFGISGFAAMVYQLGWTRGLILSIGSSTYAFATILTAFLASLGLGSLIYKRGMGERVPQVWHLGVLQMAIALSALLATYCIGRLPEVMIRAIPALEFQFARILTFDFLLVLALMFLPTLAMGLTFPLVTHLYTDRISSLGKRLGEAYAANTCGAIVGSFLAGFLLVPTFGAQKALLGAAAINLLVGLVLGLSDRKGGARPGLFAAVAVAGALSLGLSPAWDPTQLSAGAGIYYSADNFLFKPAFYKDGVSATVTVGYNGSHSPYLKVNGKTDASIAQTDMDHQVLTGLLPAALHPAPKQVAIIGLGSGVTAATVVALDSVQKVACAELEPSIVEVQSYFAPFTEQVARNPKLELSVNDGRTFILGSPQRFDLIISQPSNPWIAGIGNLYTEDFYRACIERLNEGGLMCQWANFYSFSPDDLELVLSTFFSVFPEGAVFQMSPGDMLLVGKTTTLEFDRQRLQSLWAEEDAALWLQMIGLLKPDYMLGTWVASREQVVARLKGWSGGKPKRALNTDDRPLLEFQAPRSLYLRDPSVWAYPHSFPDVVPARLSGDPEAEMGGLLGRLQLNRLIGLEPRIAKAVSQGYPLAPLAEAILLQKSGKTEQAEGLLRAIPAQQASLPEAQILLGDLRRAARQWDTALIHYALALEDPLPGSLYPVGMKAAECAVESRDLETALQYYQSVQALTTRPDPWAKAGEARLGQGDLEGAMEMFQKALEKDPNDYVALFRLATVEMDLGKPEDSYRHALASYRLFPELRPTVELLLGHAVRLGRAKDAVRYQAEINSLRMREAAQNAKR